MVKVTLTYTSNKDDVVKLIDGFSKECKYKFAYTAHLFRPDIYFVCYKHKWSECLDFLMDLEDFTQIKLHKYACFVRSVDYKGIPDR